jgi:hypothetical protein
MMSLLVAMMLRKVDITVQFWPLFSMAASVLRRERVRLTMSRPKQPQ